MAVEVLLLVNLLRDAEVGLHIVVVGSLAQPVEPLVLAVDVGDDGRVGKPFERAEPSPEDALGQCVLEPRVEAAVSSVAQSE